MADQQYENIRGHLHHEDKQGNSNRPDMTGSVEIEGVKYRIAAWNTVSKAGNHFMSLSFSVSKQGNETNQAYGQPTAQAQAPAQAAVDDGIPF